MTYILIKVGISAAIIVAVSEIAKRSSLIGGFLASLPLTSVLAMVWLYRDTQDTEQVASLATTICWLVLPSLILLSLFAAMLRKQVPFYVALGVSTAAMLACYGIMIFVLNKIGVKL
jgi:hypothetical protein